MITAVAGFRTRIPAVNIDNPLALLFGNPLQDLQAVSEGKIVDLASPNPLHSFQVERFKTQNIKPVREFMGKLPKPIRATVNHVFMPSSQVQPIPFSIGRTLLLAGQLPRCFFDLVKRLFQELGRFNLGTIRASEERFQPKIKASDSTRLDFNRGFRTVNDYNHKKLSQRSPLNGHGFDCPLNLSTVPILIDSLANLDAVATQKLIASLLQRERLVPLHLLKVWRSNSFFVMFEKQLVSLLNPLTNILHSLRSNLLPERNPLAFLSNVSLKFGAVQMLAPHPVVPFMEGDTAVIDNPSDIDHALEIPIPLVLIKLKLQGFHATIVQHNCVQKHEETIRFQSRRSRARDP